MHRNAHTQAHNTSGSLSNRHNFDRLGKYGVERDTNHRVRKTTVEKHKYNQRKKERESCVCVRVWVNM